MSECEIVNVGIRQGSCFKVATNVSNFFPVFKNTHFLGLFLVWS